MVGAGGKKLLFDEQFLTTGEVLLLSEKRERNEANITKRVIEARLASGASLQARRQTESDYPQKNSGKNPSATLVGVVRLELTRPKATRF